MTDKDNEELNSALADLQNEWSEDDQGLSTESSEHDEILSELPDANDSEVDATKSAEKPSTKDENKTSEKVAAKKNRQKVKVPKGERKPKSMFFKALVGTSVVALIGFGVFQSGVLKPSIGTSLPQAGGWQLFGSSPPETSPVVTEYQLEVIVKQLRNDVYQTLKQLPTLEQVQKLNNEISELKRIQSQQSASIRSLNSIADRQNSNLSIGGSSVDGQLAQLRSELDTLNLHTGELLSKTAKLDDETKRFNGAAKQVAELVNSNWTNHLRIKKLENEQGPEDKTPRESSDLKSAESITLSTKNEWALKIVSERFTQIYNIQTGKNLRVFEGVVIPNCGPVIDINVSARKVIAQHCTISHK